MVSWSLALLQVQGVHWVANLVSPGNALQVLLNWFFLVTSSLMLFFVVFVLLGVIFLMVCSHTCHYMGHKKKKAEWFAFYYSVFTLLLMIYPSFKLLYYFSSLNSPILIVKVVASQWYWNYEIGEYLEEAAVMYISSIEDLSVGGLRLLEVNNQLVVPCWNLVQFNVTSSDVIHSFALPTLGAKVDATAGLLTVVPIFTTKVGLHYGQCSEICGINHAFIPFCLEVSTYQSFFHWLCSLQ